MTAVSVIGDRPKRREDARFITGRGAYLDDLAFDGWRTPSCCARRMRMRGSSASTPRRRAARPACSRC